MMDPAGEVWNRAAMENGGSSPRRGDRALADALLVQGMMMNGGVDHCIEAVSDEELVAAIEGFRYLGADELADVLSRARGLDIEDPKNQGAIERLNEDYGRAAPMDQVLVALFESRFREAPEDFAPL